MTFYITRDLKIQHPETKLLNRTSTVRMYSRKHQVPPDTLCIVPSSASHCQITQVVVIMAGPRWDKHCVLCYKRRSRGFTSGRVTVQGTLLKRSATFQRARAVCNNAYFEWSPALKERKGDVSDWCVDAGGHSIKAEPPITWPCGSGVTNWCTTVHEHCLKSQMRQSFLYLKVLIAERYIFFFQDTIWKHLAQ